MRHLLVATLALFTATSVGAFQPLSGPPSLLRNQGRPVLDPKAPMGQGSQDFVGLWKGQCFVVVDQKVERIPAEMEVLRYGAFFAVHYDNDSYFFDAPGLTSYSNMASDWKYMSIEAFRLLKEGRHIEFTSSAVSGPDENSWEEEQQNGAFYLEGEKLYFDLKITGRTNYSHTCEYERDHSPRQQ